MEGVINKHLEGHPKNIRDSLSKSKIVGLTRTQEITAKIVLKLKLTLKARVCKPK